MTSPADSASVSAESPQAALGPELLGTRLRHLLDLVEADVAAVCADLGLPDGYRPRFTPVLSTLATNGPLAIRDLAGATGVTHSAASQTVAQLVKRGLVSTAPGDDARQRVVRLTAEAEPLLHVLEAEWAATTVAITEWEAELSFPLSRLVGEAIEALHQRPLRERITAAVPAESGLPRAGR